MDRKIILEPPFINNNGKIQNLILGNISCVSLIESVKGSMRSNHYHKTDYHYLYIISGSLLYLERKVGENNIPEPILYTKGQMFFTPELMEHVTIFLEDTVMISMSKNKRSHELHEKDVVRVSFISEEIKNEFLRKR